MLYLLNVRTRFLFEQRLCAERAHSPLSVARLNELMAAAQRDAYGPILHEPFPYMWASTMHFYVTGQPFYNFHYTFGYLFSVGLYAQAKAAAAAGLRPSGEAPDFPARYAALLRDTGRMTIEDLAEHHLGVDLRQPEFWQQAAAAATAPIETFLKESDPSGSTRIA